MPEFARRDHRSNAHRTRVPRRGTRFCREQGGKAVHGRLPADAHHRHVRHPATSDRPDPGQRPPAAPGAARRARRLGFGRMTAIFYDMEGYPPWQSARVLRFLSAWSIRLRALGFYSGVYSSSSSGVADLARQYGRGRYAMPDVIWDALW